MALGIVIRPQAAREFLQQAGNLAREASPAVARRFQTALAKTLRQLSGLPNMGSPFESKNPHPAGVRVWPVRRFRNYLIFYRVGDENIEILHLFHGSRDFEGLLEESE